MEEKNIDTTNICEECTSSYYRISSEMGSLCPECAHHIYNYPNCNHNFENGRCTKCFWDGSVSEYLKNIKGNSSFNITRDTFKKKLWLAVLNLSILAAESTWNKPSPNFKFILTEIKDSEYNFEVQRKLNKVSNDKKIPVAFEEIMPAVIKLYDDFYDVNVEIYRVTDKMTVVDIRYFAKSSLCEEYRKKVKDNSPMLHSKIQLPGGYSDRKEKFDINWQHNHFRNKWRMFLYRLKHIF